ncbi:protein ITPRID1 isoform X2 [Rhinatrema bivittatum]|uniref:protein ITPRID1 isoform X2 n=1 Tax=Rhinatrema bivittatum TaxID=194408 RepID=UPI0011269063|nr:protein ITPRID1 isoform X2 [Rhinatrema bivittatum]
METDPVDLLLDLGFGKEEPDLCTKIPSRFISYPSKAKGINIRVFLQAQKQRLDVENPNLYGRFRQLEILDQVTNVFSSLLNNVNTVQKKLGVKTEENAVDARQDKARRTREKWRRICQLLRKATKQNVMHQHNIQGFEIPESCPQYKEQSPGCLTTDQDGVFGKKRKYFSENRSWSLAVDEQLPIEDNTQKSSHLPKTLRDRVRKKTEMLLAKTLKKTSGIERKSPDSFEMEEIQSLDEETPRGSNTGSISEVEMTRTNSCQSDSSGFLEEPPEHLPRQVYNRESNGALSSSTMTDSEYDLLISNPSTAWKYEDGEDSLLSIKRTDVPLHFDSLRKDVVLETDEQGNCIGTTENISDCMQASLTYHQADDQDADDVTSKLDCAVPFYVVHTAFQREGSLNENVERMCKENLQQQDSLEYMNEKEGSISIFGKPHSSIPVLASMLDRSLEKMKSNAPLKSSPEQNTKCANLSIHVECSNIHSIEAEYEPECLQNKEVPSSKTEILRIEPMDPIQITETSTNFYKSVTIQMSSNLVSGSQNVPLSEYFIRDNSYESTSMSLRSDEDEEDEQILTSRLGDQGTRVKDSSVQTDDIERQLENHCPGLSDLFASQIHGFSFPAKTMPLDTRSFGKYETSEKNAQDASFDKCNHCSHCCCIHPCCFVPANPIAALQSPSVTCCSNHANIELELLQTLKLLQDSLRELSPCSLHEMERMKNSCQHFREQLVEIEQLLIEQQAFSSSALSMEGREESRRLYGLRRAVHQEVAELEFQLDDRTRQLKEGITMFEQLLEEQSKLYSELDFDNWSDEEKTQNPGASSDVTLPPVSASHLVAECPATVSSEKEKPMDSKEIQEPRLLQQKMDFSTFLRNLKKSFQNPFGSDTTELRK